MTYQHKYRLVFIKLLLLQPKGEQLTPFNTKIDSNCQDTKPSATDNMFNFSISSYNNTPTYLAMARVKFHIEKLGHIPSKKVSCFLHSVISHVQKRSYCFIFQSLIKLHK